MRPQPVSVNVYCQLKQVVNLIQQCLEVEERSRSIRVSAPESNAITCLPMPRIGQPESNAITHFNTGGQARKPSQSIPLV